jgi:endoglucanase
MMWAAVKPNDTRQFVFPPFTGVSDPQFARELQTLRQTGFDFVRFAVDPGPFLQFQGPRLDFLNRMLIRRVKLILAAGLSVIVDFHPSDMNPDYTAQALTVGSQAPIFRSYLQILQHTAEDLARLQPDRVALELMNEPPVSPDVWQPMLVAAYLAARHGSADLPLVLEGGNEASALTKMTTAPFAADPHVIYSFHYYAPYQFTHQGASWNAARYLADVPYPARARSLDDSLTATAAAIAATNLSESKKALAYQDAQARLEHYRASGFDDGAIAKAFAQIVDWARSQAIPHDRVMLGEFGARQTDRQLVGERASERAQWFSDVRRAAEDNGFGWAVWAYCCGGGFALAQSDASIKIDPEIAKALGLDAPAPR